MEGLIFLGAVAVLVLWYFVAAEFRRIAAMKGHDEERYFWWTFLVGPVGMLMVVALPQEKMVKKSPSADKSNKYEKLDKKDEAMLCAAAEEMRINKFRTVGEEVVFGHYPQREKNKDTDITWVVLNVNQSQSLLISKYALDAQRFHQSFLETDWENSDIRRWLNRTFFESAFSRKEQDAISLSKLPDEDTEDKVFLLSMAEVIQYYTYERDRSCQITTTAKESGAFCNKSGKGWWWLRTIDKNKAKAMCIDTDGQMKSVDVDNTDCSVRPVVWVNIDQLTLTSED